MSGDTPTTELRARLRAGGAPMLGTFVIVPRIEIVEALAGAGYDFVVLDCEHGPMSTPDLPPLIAAAQGAGLTTIVRVPDDRPNPIGAALDCGADGVLVPRIDGVAAAVAAVAAACFPPVGGRGANPYVRAGRYGADPDFFAAENERRSCFLMVESRAAVDQIDEIAAIEGLDGLFIGPFDLSASYEVPGQVDHPLVEGAIERVLHAANREALVTAAFVPSAAVARERREQGIQLVALSVDTRLIADGFTAAATEARR